MLILEVERNGQWCPVGWLKPGDRPGSISDRNTGTRHIVIFSCGPACSTISRLPPGVDYLVDPTIRAADQFTSDAGELLAQLRDGQSHEMHVLPDDHTHPLRMRFRHRDDGVIDRST